MKKQKLALTGLVGFAFLFGCNQVDTTNEVKAGLPTSFSTVSEEEVGFTTIYKFKDESTSCYYILGEPNSGVSGTPNIIQMFVEKDGVSVPYCDKVGE